MIIIENRCVDCLLPCLGDSCPQRHARCYYCDDCKEEVEKLYWYDNKELCIECIEKRLEKV